MKVTPPKRILYVVTKASWGGAQRYVYDLATAAKAAGHHVLVVTGAPGELTRQLSDAEIEAVCLPALARDIDILKEFRSFFALLAEIRRFRPDVIHGNSSKAGALAMLAGRLLFVPRLIFTAHGWAFNEDRSTLSRALIWLSHYVTVILSHQTLCVSEAMKRDAGSMPLVSQKLVVVRNGIAPDVLLTQEEARMMLAPHVSFPTWIGTIAELHPTKRIDTLIRAFGAIAPEFPDATLVILGEGEERLALEGLVRDLGLESRVRLRGHVERAAAYLSALDVFVLPSRSEALGYVLLEAGLASLPVAASNVGGIPEIIEDGVTGTLFPAGDENAIADALRSYLSSPELRLAHARALYERVTNDFTIERMVEQTLAAY